MVLVMKNDDNEISYKFDDNDLLIEIAFENKEEKEKWRKCTTSK